MVQVVVLVLGENLKVGLFDDRDAVIHGKLDKIKFIDASGGTTVKEYFPGDPINIIFYGHDLTMQYSNNNLIVFSGYVEEYSLVTIDGDVLAKYKLQANSVYVKIVEEGED